MKLVLFLINSLLVVALFSMTAYNLFNKGKDSQIYSVKRNEKKTAAVKPSPNRSIQTKKEDQESVIVKQNLFNPERNPNAQNGRGVGQVQLTLVGVSITDKSKGAVILQRSGGNRRFFPQGFTPFGNRPQNQPQQALQQYIRVGEKLANGYELTEVTRTSAVLTLNGNRMELKLQEASKNQPQTRRTVQNRPTTNNLLQQMQNMQRMQMMQNMQMMRMIRQGQGQNTQGQWQQPVQQRGNRGGQTIRR